MYSDEFDTSSDAGRALRQAAQTLADNAAQIEATAYTLAGHVDKTQVASLFLTAANLERIAQAVRDCADEAGSG